MNRNRQEKQWRKHESNESVRLANPELQPAERYGDVTEVMQKGMRQTYRDPPKRIGNPAADARMDGFESALRLGPPQIIYPYADAPARFHQLRNAVESLLG